jgi:hypothetical protein
MHPDRDEYDAHKRDLKTAILECLALIVMAALSGAALLALAFDSMHVQ